MENILIKKGDGFWINAMKTSSRFLSKTNIKRHLTTRQRCWHPGLGGQYMANRLPSFPRESKARAETTQVKWCTLELAEKMLALYYLMHVKYVDFNRRPLKLKLEDLTES
jgi:hypothetical protein